MFHSIKVAEYTILIQERDILLYFFMVTWNRLKSGMDLKKNLQVVSGLYRLIFRDTDIPIYLVRHIQWSLWQMLSKTCSTN